MERWKAWWRKLRERVLSWLPLRGRFSRPAWEIPLPGFRPQGIQVRLQGDTLWIRAWRHREDFRWEPYGFRFCSLGYSQVVAIPVGHRFPVRAEYRDGLLRLFAPWGSPSRRIPVRRASR